MTEYLHVEACSNLDLIPENCGLLLGDGQSRAAQLKGEGLSDNQHTRYLSPVCGLVKQRS